MRVYAETSFIVALFGQDTHTAKALRWWVDHDLPMMVSGIVVFEAENTFRAAHLRGLISAEFRDACLARVQRAIMAGKIHVLNLNLKPLLTEARRISAFSSTGLPHRAMDVLHVAAACLLRCAVMLSFDENQSKLAKDFGLVVSP